MKNFSSLIGWLILIGVLAVPAFLFYNWISSKKTEQAARTRPVAVDQSRLFDSEGKPQAPAQVKQPEQADPVRQPQAETRPPSPAALSPVAASVTAPVVTTESVTAVQPVVADTRPSPVKTAQPIAVSTMSYFDPKSKRDPTLTPGDYQKIKEEEERLRRAQRQREQDALKKKGEDSPLIRMTLQGVVGTSAIINGEMVNEGQTFRGMKIMKVGANYVIGIYNGKRYKLTLK